VFAWTEVEKLREQLRERDAGCGLAVLTLKDRTGLSMRNKWSFA
jgi:hypothetical protein